MGKWEVILKQYDETGFGYYTIFKDIDTKMGFLYGHMNEPTFLEVGEIIENGTLVGFEGTSGHSTGVHLHLEMQDLTNANWQFGADLSVYKNPSDFLGIPNVQGISAIYEGVPVPPTPTTKKTRKFNWVLYAKKLRNKRILQ